MLALEPVRLFLKDDLRDATCNHASSSALQRVIHYIARLSMKMNSVTSDFCASYDYKKMLQIIIHLSTQRPVVKVTPHNTR